MMPMTRALAVAVLLVYVIGMYLFRNYGRPWWRSRSIDKEIAALPPLDYSRLRPVNQRVRLNALPLARLDAEARAARVDDARRRYETERARTDAMFRTALEHDARRHLDLEIGALMAFIQSAHYRANHSHAQAQRGPFVGTYSLINARSVETTVPCPYCREPLTARVGQGLERVVQVMAEHADGSRDVIVVPIPETHRLLRCLPCDARFVGEA